MLAIRVKYVGATNYRPSRLIASINGPNGKTRSVSVSWNAAEDAAGTTSNSAAVYAQAAKALMRKFGLVGELVGGELPDGSQAFVFTKTGAGLEIANTRHKNPRPRIGNKKPLRASSATGKRPTKRLVARRKSNTRKGYFPNPRKAATYYIYSPLSGILLDTVVGAKAAAKRAGKDFYYVDAANSKIIKDTYRGRSVNIVASIPQQNTAPQKGYFPNPDPLQTLRYHVTGAIKRGEKNAIVEIPAIPAIPGVHIEPVKDYKGRDFSQGAFFVSSDHSGPGWFIFGRSFDEYAPQGIIRKMAWPDQPARRYAKYNGRVNAGFPTKKAAQAIADILNRDEKQRAANPKKRAVVNRWGTEIKPGEIYSVATGAGLLAAQKVVKLETSGAYAKAYGPRVIFESGGSASIDDLRPYSRNPTRRAIRQGIRFYRKHGGKWLMFDPAVYVAKTKNQAVKIAGNLAKMFKTQIKVVLQK